MFALLFLVLINSFSLVNSIDLVPLEQDSYQLNQEAEHFWNDHQKVIEDGVKAIQLLKETLIGTDEELKPNNGQQLVEIEKRNNPAFPLSFYEGERCDFVGKEKFQMEPAKLCEGKSGCHPLEAICNGTIFRFSPNIFNTVPDYSGRFATSCTITKLRCFHPETNAGYYYDLKEMYGSSNCTVDRVMCVLGMIGVIYPPSEVSNKRLVGTEACFTQVLCSDNKRYGFEYWGWKCQQQEIICNGRVMDANISYVNPSCTVRQRQCNSPDIKSDCYDYKITCVGQKTRNGCIYNQLNTSCINGHSDCKLSQVNCSGIIYNAPNFPSSLNGCTIPQINCARNTTTFSSSNFGNNCIVSEMNCSNVAVNPMTYSGPFQNCTIKKLLCDMDKQCRQLDFVCDGNPSCIVESNTSLCLNNGSCFGMQNNSHCICPVDREGPSCYTRRGISCNMTLEHPSSCNSDQYFQLTESQKLLDSDWPCLMYNLNDEISLGYKLKCQFVNGMNVTDDMKKANFSYFVQNKEFAISDKQVWNLLAKLWNFRQLADQSGANEILLNREQIQGDSLIWFNFSTPKEIPERFFVGNRLYLEIGWNDDDVNLIVFPNFEKSVFERRFLDLIQPRVDLAGKTQSSVMNKTLLILAVILIGIGIWIGIALLKKYVLNKKDY